VQVTYLVYVWALMVEHLLTADMSVVVATMAVATIAALIAVAVVCVRTALRGAATWPGTQCVRWYQTRTTRWAAGAALSCVVAAGFFASVALFGDRDDHIQVDEVIRFPLIWAAMFLAIKSLQISVAALSAADALAVALRPFVGPSNGRNGQNRLAE
jgi:hypothetical protein